MDGDHARYLIEKAFKGLEPDENGRTITTIRAPRGVWKKPGPETYKKPRDLAGKFDVRHSLIKGDGLLSAPQFVCFPSERAQAEFVVQHPEKYLPEFVKACQSKIRACSSGPSEVSSSCTFSSLEVQAPLSRKSPSLPSSPDLPPTIEGDPCTPPSDEPPAPPATPTRSRDAPGPSACTEEPRETSEPEPPCRPSESTAAPARDQESTCPSEVRSEPATPPPTLDQTSTRASPPPPSTA